MVCALRSSILEDISRVDPYTFTVATTIASLHLLAVLAVALLTKSRSLTWIAAGVVLYVAVAVGSSGYAVMDAVSTLLGLAIGLSLIGDRTETPRSSPNPAERVAPRTPPDLNLAPAKMFELHPPPKSYTGRWAVTVLIGALACWWASR